MGLRNLPHKQLGPLISAYLSTQESIDTADKIRKLRPARDRGYLTPVGT